MYEPFLQIIELGLSHVWQSKAPNSSRARGDVAPIVCKGNGETPKTERSRENGMVQNSLVTVSVC